MAAEIKLMQTAHGLRAAECGEWRIVAYAMGGYSVNRYCGANIGWCLLTPDDSCPEDIERALCAALGIDYEP